MRLKEKVALKRHTGGLSLFLAVAAVTLASMLSPASTASAASAPIVTSVGCPASAQVGQSLTCTPTVTGTVTKWEWYAYVGSPAKGTGPTFSTTFSAPGMGYVRLEACNGASCSHEYAKITITPVPPPPAPVIGSLGCPTAVTAGQSLTCSPTVTGNVTKWEWHAYPGTPSAGTASTFSTTFATPGYGYVKLEVCNGTACKYSYQKITVNHP